MWSPRSTPVIQDQRHPLTPTSTSHPPSALIAPSRPTTATTSDLQGAGSTSSSRHVPSNHTTHLASTSNALLLSQAAPREPLQVLSTFTQHAAIRGTVLIKVEKTTFLAHREILALASPFFECVLAGGWKETAHVDQPKTTRRSGGDTNSTPPGPRLSRRMSRQSIAATQVSTDVDPDEELVDAVDQLDVPGLAFSSLQTNSDAKAFADEAISEADGPAPSIMSASYVSSIIEDLDDLSSIFSSSTSSDWGSTADHDPSIICRLRLKEESASSFQDLLCHIYPHLTCCITHYNAGDLFRMSAKFDIPNLRTACIAYLLPNCSTNPLRSMAIAEEHHIPELYREASRTVLDNLQNWPAEELAGLSEATLLKLERRRSWFLERLLKLGLVQTSRDYNCAPTCPDPSLCARLLDEKWKSTFSTSFRFGTPQPSTIYALRSLDSLMLPMTACQLHAKSVVRDLFDRVFKIYPSGRVGRNDQNKMSEKCFLFIEMGGFEDHLPPR